MKEDWNGFNVLHTAAARVGGIRDRALAASARLGTGRPPALVFTSALTGLPPFYVVSVAAGMLGFRPGHFLLAGLAGRLLRFGAVFALPASSRG